MKALLLIAALTIVGMGMAQAAPDDEPKPKEVPKIEEKAKLIKSTSGDTCWMTIPGKTVRYSISGLAARPAFVHLSGITSVSQTDQFIHIGYYNRMEDYRFSSAEAAQKVYDQIVEIALNTECFR